MSVEEATVEIGLDCLDGEYGFDVNKQSNIFNFALSSSFVPQGLEANRSRSASPLRFASPLIIGRSPTLTDQKITHGVGYSLVYSAQLLDALRRTFVTTLLPFL